MKTYMLGVAPLCLLLCWMLPVGSMKISRNVSKNETWSIPLNMCENSVDDMYSTCVEEMEKKINDLYFKKEINLPLFKSVWKKAEVCTKNRWPPEDKDLTKNHIQAICVYTSEFKKFYQIFSVAVRTQRAKYSSSFEYHSLHFWLTRAVQILNKNKACQVTYRRSNAMFTGDKNSVIRFGSFTSTSKLTNLTRFGNETCFKIRTCSGAYLKKYPVLGNHEQEVLIPPYEKFKIKEICDTDDCKSSLNLSDCKTVFKLKSVGVQSNLDCQLIKENMGMCFS